MMNDDKKNKTQLIRTEILKIKNEKQKFSYENNKYFDFIEQNISYITNSLCNIVKVKTQGSYRILKNKLQPKIINGRRTLVVDLVAIKYISREQYLHYQENINDVKSHNPNCEICFIKHKIFEIMISKYSKVKNVDVSYKKKQYSNRSKKSKLDYYDAISIDFDVNDKSLFEKIKIIIRPAVSSKDFPLIICNEKILRRSFSKEYINTYKSLNKITNGYLNHLILKVDNMDFDKSNFDKKLLRKFDLFEKCNRKELLIIKHGFMSFMINKIFTSEWIKKWLSKNYNNYFTDQMKIAEIFQDKNFRYKRVPLFEKVYNNFKLKYLDYVGMSIWPVFEKLNIDFINYINWLFDGTNKLIVENVNNEFMIENQILVRFDYISQMYTIKGAKKLFNELNIRLKTNTIYGDNDTGANILLFNILYNIEYMDISDYCHRLDRVSEV